MIPAIFLLLGGTLLHIVNFLLNAAFAVADWATFNQIIPRLTIAVAWVFKSVHYLDGVLPVNDILLAGTVLLVWGAMLYFTKGMLWLLSFIPGISHKEVPSIHGEDDNTLDLRVKGRRSVDLSYGRRPKGRIDKRMRF